MWLVSKHYVLPPCHTIILSIDFNHFPPLTQIVRGNNVYVVYHFSFINRCYKNFLGLINVLALPMMKHIMNDWLACNVFLIIMFTLHKRPLN